MADDRQFPDHIAITVGTLWYVVTVIAALIGFGILGSWWFAGNVTNKIDHIAMGQEQEGRDITGLEHKLDENHAEAVTRQDNLQRQMSELRNQFIEMFVYEKPPKSAQQYDRR